MEGDGPIGLIMAPTRELAHQISTECKIFARVLGMRVACISGGVGLNNQIADLKRGAEIVVCTPGRMIDVLTMGNGKITNLRRVSFVVLDEADRMLDFGFEPQISKILSNIRPDRQTTMFSATFPKNVEKLAKNILNKPIEIIVGTIGKICSNIEQVIEVIDESSKFLRLLQILGEWSEKGNILIFMNTQTDADNLFKELLKYAYYPLVLHGGQDADDRDNTISDFKKGIRTLMIATSVCARGLDIKSLVLVVNYQCPHHKEDYIHRIGRTGRAGKKGTAITFLTPQEDQYAYDISTALKMSNIEPPQDLVSLVDNFMEKVKKGEAKIYHNSNRIGTGFTFDKNDDKKLKEGKKTNQRQFGYQLDPSDDDLSDEMIINNQMTKDDKNESLDENQIKNMLKDPNLRIEANKAGEKAAKDAILAGVTSNNEILQVTQNAIMSFLTHHRRTGLEQAATLVNEIEGRMNRGDEHVSIELEINDYPLVARTKVTQKNFLNMIQDFTNCSISLRGMYFEPKKKVAPGQKKLNLHIMGESKADVEYAYKEIKRALNEAATHAINSVYGYTGKYSL
jgi:ATP-dependent RNA helicase DDX46/PRP5